VSRGIYKLEDSAREFLEEYPELAEHYMNLIAEMEQTRSLEMNENQCEWSAEEIKHIRDILFV